MNKDKTQTARILECFLTAVIIISAVTLVFSGVAISKVNTDYMETGVRAAKIVAERENMQISVTTHEGILLSPQKNFPVDMILKLLPPPVNTSYFIAKELTDFAKNNFSGNETN